jgi:hypothetical protein
MAANFLPKVAKVAQRHPPLAKYPNIAMKATGAPSYSDQAYPFREVHDKLRQLYDAFTSSRTR